MPYFSETITKANYYILRRWQQRLCRIRGECARAKKKTAVLAAYILDVNMPTVLWAY